MKINPKIHINSQNDLVWSWNNKNRYLKKKLVECHKSWDFRSSAICELASSMILIIQSLMHRRARREKWDRRRKGHAPLLSRNWSQIDSNHYWVIIRCWLLRLDLASLGKIRKESWEFVGRTRCNYSERLFHVMNMNINRYIAITMYYYFYDYYLNSKRAKCVLIVTMRKSVSVCVSMIIRSRTYVLALPSKRAYSSIQDVASRW